jgi:toxin ParE1/3/4
VKEIRLRPAAQGDVAEIRRYTRRTWGVQQAATYLDGLAQRLDEIARGTAAARPSERDTQCVRYRSHLIYFRTAKEHVTIVRMLHERMDIPSHLHSEA